MATRAKSARPASTPRRPQAGRARAVKKHAPAAALPTYQRILVPLDGSRSSFAALRAALALACALDATVVGYHALPSDPVPHFDAPPPGYPSPAEQRATMRQLAKRYFEKAARVAALVGVRLETTADVRGDVAEAIAAAARRRRCDLIFLGSHGRGAFGRLLMGSVATRLLSIASVPVLVLPQQAVASRKAGGKRAR